MLYSLLISKQVDRLSVICLRMKFSINTGMPVCRVESKGVDNISVNVHEVILKNGEESISLGVVFNLLNKGMSSPLGI